MKAHAAVRGSDGADFDWVAGFDHLAAADHHRDVAVPDREVARHQIVLIDLVPDSLFLSQPRNVDSGLAVRPLSQPAAVQTDSRRSASPGVRDTLLSERVAYGSSGLGVRCGGNRAVGKFDLNAT